jgi:hypothetical protein
MASAKVMSRRLSGTVMADPAPILADDWNLVTAGGVLK